MTDADGELGRLHGRRVDRPAAVEVERDPAAREQLDHLGGPLDGNPSELDPVREHEHVRSEAVPAEVGGLPEPLRRDVRRQRVEERQAEARAAGVATAVGADEDDRARRRDRPASRSAPGSSSSEPSSCRTAVPPSSSTVARMTVTPRRRSGRRTSDHLPRKRVQRVREPPAAARCRRPRPSPTLRAPRRAASSSPWVAVPASGSPAASDDAGAASTHLAHAGQPVGEQPAERRVDPELGRERAVLGERLRRVTAGARDGAEQDVLRRVLELDELEHLHVVADGAEQLGAGGVRHLGGEALAQRAVPEQRPERRALELGQELVLAAGHGEDHRRTGAHGAIERVVGRGVAGVQADDEIDAGERVVPGDVADLEAQAVGAEPPRQRLAVGRRPRP